MEMETVRIKCERKRMWKKDMEKESWEEELDLNDEGIEMEQQTTKPMKEIPLG